MGGFFHYDRDSGMGYYVDDKDIAEVSGHIFMGLGALALLYLILVPIVLAVFAPFITLFVLDDFVNVFVAKNTLFFLLLGGLVAALKLFPKTGGAGIVRFLFDAFLLTGLLYCLLYVLDMATPVYAVIGVLGQYLPEGNSGADLLKLLSEDAAVAAAKDSWIYGTMEGLCLRALDAMEWLRTTFQQVDTSGFQEMDILACLKAIGIYLGLFGLALVGMIVGAALGTLALVLTAGLPYLLALVVVIVLNKLIFRLHTARIRSCRKTEAKKLLLEQQKQELDDRLKGASMQSTVTVCLEMANAGNAHAQLRLAQCYLHGEGTLINEKEAFRWYRQAALQGVTKGQVMTALCYFSATGTGKNKRLARAWLDTAMKDKDFVAHHRDKKDLMKKLLKVRRKTRLVDCL